MSASGLVRGRRVVTVTIPDVDSCEAALRYAADRMSTVGDVIVLDRPPGIPDDWIEEFFKHLTAWAEEHAAKVRVLYARLYGTAPRA